VTLIVSNLQSFIFAAQCCDILAQSIAWCDLAPYFICNLLSVTNI